MYIYMAAAPVVGSSVEFHLLQCHCCSVPPLLHMYVALSLSPGVCRVGVGVVVALGACLRA